MNERDAPEAEKGSAGEVPAGAAPAGTHPGDQAPPDARDAGENICPDCGGSGRRDGQSCATCGGTGRVIETVGGE